MNEKQKKEFREKERYSSLFREIIISMRFMHKSQILTIRNLAEKLLNE